MHNKITFQSATDGITIKSLMGIIPNSIIDPNILIPKPKTLEEFTSSVNTDKSRQYVAYYLSSLPKNIRDKMLIKLNKIHLNDSDKSERDNIEPKINQFLHPLLLLEWLRINKSYGYGNTLSNQKEIGKKLFEAIISCHAYDLPQWLFSNWGTKWQPELVSQSDLSILFITADTHPFKYIRKLSEKAPNIEMYIDFVDESPFNNTFGNYLIHNGKTSILEQKPKYEILSKIKKENS